MKGFGAFLVFIFLSFFFAWGIGSIVAGIRSIFSDKFFVPIRSYSNNKSLDHFDASDNGKFEKIRKAGELH